MNFYEFATESPFLTFFLAMIGCELIIGIFKAIFKKSVTIKLDKEEKHYD
jgi:hypothetical protein